jgi:hypothetical protein
VKEVVRLGYVGAGFMAQKVHLPNFASLPNCRLIALAEMRPKLGELVARRFGIPKVYRHHSELIADPEVDAVAVSASYAAQGEIARDALLAGKPVFVEKPMAVSVEQAEGILNASRQTGAPLMVAYMKRYDAGYELAKEWVSRFRQTGELGRITLVRLHYFGGDWICGLDTPFVTTDEPAPPSPTIKPSWLPDEHVGRYIGFLQQYVHAFNWVRWLLDAGDEAQVVAVDLDADGYTRASSFCGWQAFGSSWRRVRFPFTVGTNTRRFTLSTVGFIFGRPRCCCAISRARWRFTLAVSATSFCARCPKTDGRGLTNGRRSIFSAAFKRVNLSDQRVRTPSPTSAFARKCIGVGWA